MRRLAIALLYAGMIGILLSGCASVAVPTYQRTTPPERWSKAPPSPTLINITAREQHSGQWWSQLHDDTLDRLITESIDINADLAVAAARLQQARAVADGAAAARRPRLDASAGAARERSPRSTLRDTDGTSATTPPFTQARFSAQLEVGYEIDLLGRLSLAKQAADAAVEASESDVIALRRWLAHAVVSGYIDVRLADDELLRSRAAQTLQHAIVRAETQRLVAGLSTRSALREAQRGLDSLIDAERLLDTDRELALTRLAVLLGKAPVDMQLASQDDYFERHAFSGALAPALPAEVLAERADVAAAWQRVVAAGIDAERTRRARFPALTLTSNTGYLSQSLRAWLTGESMAWLLQASLLTPLLDGGRNKADTKQAIAQAGEQHAAYRKVVLQALAEVENALSELESAQARLALAQAEHQRRSEDHEAERAALQAGTADRPSVVRTELALIDALSTMRRRQRDAMAAWADAQQALGE